MEGNCISPAVPALEVEGLPGERRRRALVQSKDRTPYKSPAGWTVCSQQGLQTTGVTLALARPPIAGGPAQIWEAEGGH